MLDTNRKTRTSNTGRAADQMIQVLEWWNGSGTLRDNALDGVRIEINHFPQMGKNEINLTREGGKLKVKRRIIAREKGLHLDLGAPTEILLSDWKTMVKCYPINVMNDRHANPERKFGRNQKSALAKPTNQSAGRGVLFASGSQGTSTNHASYSQKSSGIITPSM